MALKPRYSCPNFCEILYDTLPSHVQCQLLIPKLTRRQLLIPPLLLHPLRRNPVRIIPQKHIREMRPIVDPLPGLLTRVVPGQRPEDGAEVGLVEVGKGEALAGVEADLVRGGGEGRVGEVLEHVAGEDGEGVGDGGHVEPVGVVFLVASGRGGPVCEGVVFGGGEDEEA